MDSGGSGLMIGGVNVVNVKFDATPVANYVLNFHFDQGFIKALSVNPGAGDNTINFVSGGSHVLASVTTGAGKDHLDVQSGADLRGISFRGGEGDNMFDFEGKAGSAAFSSYEGVDTLNLAAAASVGKLTATVRGNADVLNLLGTVKGKASLTTGQGPDTIKIEPTANLGALAILAGSESDVITLAGLVAGKNSIDVSVGDDQVTLLPSSSAGKLAVVLGAGLDTISLAGSVVTSASVSAGADMDTVTLNNGLSVVGGLSINLGSGNNFLNSAAATSSALSPLGSLTISASSGDDTIHLSGVEVTKTVTLKLGAGANSLDIPARISGAEIASVKAAKLSYTGGGGTDTITVGSSQSVIGSAIFNLSSGDDSVSFTGSKSSFTSSLKVYGSKGDDTLIGQSLFTDITTTFSSIEHRR